VRLREPAIDLASAADSNLVGISDPDVLEIASQQRRILVSHDQRTMVNHFRTRLAEGKSSPGVFLVTQSARVVDFVEAIVMVWSASEPRNGKINYATCRRCRVIFSLVDYERSVKLKTAKSFSPSAVKILYRFAME
jgi:hypothetical protein